MANQYLEDMIYQLLSRKLTDGEKRRLHSWYDVTEHIDEESREDIKEELFRFVLDALHHYRVISRLQANVPDKDSEEEEENDIGW